MLYFDHNATSPLSPTARDAWLRASEQLAGNASSPHRLGARTEYALQKARQDLADLLGCSADDLVFTSGATEANNSVFHHLLDPGGTVFVSSIEHPSVVRAAGQWFKDRVRMIPACPDGQVDVGWLAETLKHERPALVAVMATNNETGVLQPWTVVRDLCREAGVPYLCDASQWFGKEPLRELGTPDFVSGCAHKFGGPLGVGFLKIPSAFKPLLVGGPQENGYRAGTENVPGIIAMVAALQERCSTMGAQSEKRVGFRDRFAGGLRDMGATIVGEGCDRLWNTVMAIMPPIDCRQRWIVKLDKAGVAASTGSACSSGKEKPSHVLTAMGIAPEDAARAIRFSSGWETGAEDWNELLRCVVKAAVELELS